MKTFVVILLFLCSCIASFAQDGVDSNEKYDHIAQNALHHTLPFISNHSIANTDAEDITLISRRLFNSSTIHIPYPDVCLSLARLSSYPAERNIDFISSKAFLYFIGVLRL